MTEASTNDDALLGRLVRAFGGVPGIRAIVLGGSRARGEATAQSDYDLGLYYEADHPIDVGRLAKAAMLLLMLSSPSGASHEPSRLVQYETSRSEDTLSRWLWPASTSRSTVPP